MKGRWNIHTLQRLYSGRASHLCRVLGLPAFLGVLLRAALVAQSANPPSSGVLVEGEELTYNVRYGFIDLGQVRIKVIDKAVTPDYLAYNGRAYIDSYSGVPFVDLHAVYESVFDSAIFSRGFRAKTRDGKSWSFSQYHFQYDKNRVIIETGSRDSTVDKRDTVRITSSFNDGLSIFFFARQQLLSGKKISIPTMVTEKKANTYIDFKNKRTTVEIDVVDYPVDVIEFDGSADFVGVFGLTGEFEGWFSNDGARVPILAKMKVILGSVTIELMGWKRPGWQPPRGAK